MWLELILSPAIGAIVGILITMLVEYLRRPRLTLSIEPNPRDFFPQQPARPANVVRPVRVTVTNKPGPWWMTRDPALRCQATITFRHLNDGQDIFGRSMEGRWTTSPEPTPIEITGEVDQGTGTPVAGLDAASATGKHPIKLYMRDPSRVTPISRIDIHAGESVPLDVAVRCDADQECYGWNNWSYCSTPPCRNPAWRLGEGRYLVEVMVTSSGQTCRGLYRLINDVARSDFRLEEARAEDHAKVR
jgi:hypothetical protein